MTDTTGLTQSREAGLNSGGFTTRTFAYQQDICAHRPQRVISVIPKGPLKIPS